MSGVSRRGLAGLLGLAVAGGVGGWAWSAGREPSPGEGSAPAPPLETGIGLRVQRVGPPGNQWTVAVPKEWVRDLQRPRLLRYVPPDGAPQRLRLVFFEDDRTIEQALDDKLFERGRESREAHVEFRGTDSLRFRLVDQLGNDRMAFYRWFGRGGQADLELVIDGRAEDVDGLADLFEQVSNGIRPID